MNPLKVPEAWKAVIFVFFRECDGRQSRSLICNKKARNPKGFEMNPESWTVQECQANKG
ncbi:hypothetical protein [Burkholderia sp.]|uniref:hypothetical protein n=1 Tax=Burkholderia sp. TaxID=36773 RepID=UPI0025BB2EFE|nr:hypothetical protein [Burkholderia sp.]MBS6360531.1 hypothetical protein [Burkholderia sp.]